MFPGYWSDFIILFMAAFIGSVAILPYSLRLLKESGKSTSLKLPLKTLIILSILQNGVLFFIVIGSGLFVAHQIGLTTPLLTALRMGKGVNVSLVLPGFLLGIIGGLVLLLSDLLFLPHLPEKLRTTALKTTQWENITASFYGGINEELLTRLFGMSLVAWLLSRIWHTALGTPTSFVFWSANLLMAVLFAIGHLPTLKKLLGEISHIMLLRTLLLNTPIGLICGWLFWHYGIEAAIVAHFTADIVYHVGGTFVLRSTFRTTYQAIPKDL